MNGVNLMPEPRLRAAALRRRLRRWIAGVAAYAVLMAVVCFASWTHAEAASDDVRFEIARATQRLIDAERRAQTNNQQAEQLERALAATRAVGEHPDWSLLLRLLAEHRGDDLVLRSIEITVAPTASAASASVASGPDADKAPPGSTGDEAYDIRVTGVGLTQQRVLGYAGELQQWGREASSTAPGVFTSVDVKRTYSEEFAGRQCVGFEIECRLAPRRQR